MTRRDLWRWVRDHISEPTEDDDGNEPEKDDTQLLFGVGYTFWELRTRTSKIPAGRRRRAGLLSGVLHPFAGITDMS